MADDGGDGSCVFSEIIFHSTLMQLPNLGITVWDPLVGCEILRLSSSIFRKSSHIEES